MLMGEWNKIESKLNSFSKNHQYKNTSRNGGVFAHLTLNVVRGRLVLAETEKGMKNRRRHGRATRFSKTSEEPYVALFVILCTSVGALYFKGLQGLRFDLTTEGLMYRVADILFKVTFGE